MTVSWNGPKLIAAVTRGAMRGVVVGAGIVENEAVQLVLGTAKTGRIYRRRSVVHQASAPGEPFAQDTGDTLRRREIVLDQGRITASLVFRSLNAVRMEFGTRNIEPRPFARPAISKSRAAVANAIAAEIAEELR